MSLAADMSPEDAARVEEVIAAAITSGLRGRQHRHAGGTGWKRGYHSHEGRSFASRHIALTAPRQPDLVLDDVRLRAMTPAERQAVLRATAQLLLRGGRRSNAGGRE